MYFGLEVIQEYVCGGENVFCEAERAMVREFLHGGRGDQVGASTGIFHAPSSNYGTHAQLRYPEQVAMIRHNPDTQDQWTYHYLHDVLGSVIGVVNESGDLVERYTLDAGERLCRSPRAGRTRSIRRRVKGTTYDPYGKVFIEKWDDAANEGSGARVERASECGTGVPACGQMPYSSIGNPFLWTGHRYDAAVGLYHTLFRFYEPTLGRWLQRDPIEYEAGSINLSEYVLSAPLFWIDPLGLMADVIVGGERWRMYKYDVDMTYGPHYHNKNTGERLYPDLGKIRDKNGKWHTVSSKQRKAWSNAGVKIGAIAGLLGAFIAQNAMAIEEFTKQNSECGAFFRAGLRCDCSTMQEFADRCAEQLEAAGLYHAGLNFRNFAQRLVGDCERRRAERDKEKEERERGTCPGSGAPDDTPSKTGCP